MIALLPCDLPAIYVQVLDWWFAWKPGRLLLVPSQSFFAYYSGQMLRGSEVDKAYVWRMVITKILVLALFSFGTATHDGVFMWKTEVCQAENRCRWFGVVDTDG